MHWKTSETITVE